jgi:soluble lytic murein transglycosylase
MPGAQVEYEAARAADSQDYYGMRAAGLGLVAEPEPGDLSPPPPDWAAAETWLRGFAGAEGAAASSTLFTSPPWRRAMELWEAGLRDRASEEFTAVMESVTGDAWALYRLSRELDELGLPWISTLAAQRLSFQAADPPPAVLRLVYPLAYIDLVEKEAEEFGFDPLLQLSMIRQESLYQPDAVSIAEAMGLTQVIPDTADYIAEQLGEDDFRYSDLFRPNVSVRFGAFYVGGLIEEAGGDVGVALAGYNGGPGNAAAWAEGAGGDPDLFLESITFPETRAYVEIVMENWALYRYAWGVTDTARLAR